MSRVKRMGAIAATSALLVGTVSSPVLLSTTRSYRARIAHQISRKRLGTPPS